MFVVAFGRAKTLSHPTVQLRCHTAGPHGMTIAFIAEFIIAFVLMTVVLNVSNTPHLARYTGFSPEPGRDLHHASKGLFRA